MSKPTETKDTMETFVRMSISYFEAGITSTTLELEKPFGLDCKVKIEVTPMETEQ